jgi:hypothetical protein
VRAAGEPVRSAASSGDGGRHAAHGGPAAAGGRDLGRAVRERARQVDAERAEWGGAVQAGRGNRRRAAGGSRRLGLRQRGFKGGERHGLVGPGWRSGCYRHGVARFWRSGLAGAGAWAPGECNSCGARERAGAGRHRRNGCAGAERTSDDRS